MSIIISRITFKNIAKNIYRKGNEKGMNTMYYKKKSYKHKRRKEWRN